MTISPYFKQIKSNVDRVGLHLFGIFGSEDNPPFTYTIGFAAHGLPEVIVFGLDMKMVAPFLNMYYDQIVNQKTREAGPAVLEGDDWFNMPMSVINCDPDKIEEYAVQAFAFAEDIGWSKPNFVQWVWPDTKGKLPWNAGYEKEKFGKVQPLLARFV